MTHRKQHIFRHPYPPAQR